MRFAKIVPFAAVLVLWAGAAPVRAAAVQVDYEISLSGLSIGTADLSANLNSDRYTVQIHARLTGLAGALTGGRAGASATGSVASAKPLPFSYAVTSVSSSDQRSVRLTMERGNVAAVHVAPPIDDRADRVPVKEIHKRGVLDPVSALLMPFYGRRDAADPAACNRTLPVFDGAARYDVVLRYAETRIVEKPGYSGPVVVCNARYVPIAGHRPDRPATKFMQDNQDLSVWLAPLDGTRVLLPIRISVRTMIGVSVIEASRWSQDREVRPVPTSARRRGSKAERL
jgi:hypothetical protein